MRMVPGTTIVHAAALLCIGSVAHAISAADKCEAAKNKLAGKYALCRQKAEAKAIKTGTAPDYLQCDIKLGDKWMMAETVGAGMCPTIGDVGQVHACIAADTDRLVTALSGAGSCVPLSGLPRTGQIQCDQGAGTLGACAGSPAGQDGAVLVGNPRSYTDNGDGTVTDNVTNLTWEKLSDDGGIHDEDEPYTWYDAFAVKIAALNSGSGFAGHTDWRIPNRFELKSLVDLGHSDPAVDPAFNNNCVAACTVLTCSCTNADNYWSSTSAPVIGPAFTWYVDFDNGFVDANNKTVALGYVRAVRGGS